MINNTSAKLTIRQSNIHTERDERLGWTARGVLTEAILELLAERGILTGEEVLERVKKLKSESPVQFRWMQ